MHVRDVLPGGAVASATRLVLRRRADQRVAITSHVAGALGLPAVLVENPIDLERLDPTRVDISRAREGLCLADRPAVAHVAQLTEWKGQLDLVEAWPQVLARVPDAVLLLVGEMKFSHPGSRWDNAAYVDRLHHRIEQLGLTDAVRLLGERRDIPEILAAVDLLALPSWDEPFGRAAAEAMAMSRPVVVTSVGGPGEFVLDGESGLLLSPKQPTAWAEAIADLLSDPERRARMGAAGRAVASERFSRERHAAAMLQVFDSVAG